MNPQERAQELLTELCEIDPDFSELIKKEINRPEGEQRHPLERPIPESVLRLVEEMRKEKRFGIAPKTLENVRAAKARQHVENAHIAIFGKEDTTAETGHRLGLGGPHGTTPGFTRRTPRQAIPGDPAWTKAVVCEDGHALSPFVPTDPESTEVEQVADYTPYDPETRAKPTLKAQ